MPTGLVTGTVTEDAVADSTDATIPELDLLVRRNLRRRRLSCWMSARDNLVPVAKGCC